ncbi:MAG: hypothetical protein EKK47_18205 [Burkholderiales bacterium]|nr:MAG: hypothetical protein EKK47_18205 [Burkholderiales bacterium]
MGFLLSVLGVETGLTVGQDAAAAVLVGLPVFLVRLAVAAVEVLHFLGADLVPLLQGGFQLLGGLSRWACGFVLVLHVGRQALALLGVGQLHKLTRKHVFLEVDALAGVGRFDVLILGRLAFVAGASVAKL